MKAFFRSPRVNPTRLESQPRVWVAAGSEAPLRFRLRAGGEKPDRLALDKIAFSRKLSSEAKKTSRNPAANY
jgi:hypothetical protein